MKNKSRMAKFFNDWGGAPVFGAGALILIFVIWLIWSNRPGSTVSDEVFESNDSYLGLEVDGTKIGDPSAPLTIWIHEDFQCSHCKTFSSEITHPLIDTFVKNGDAQLVFVNTPILGNESVNAAIGSLCAADQNVFWQYHDLLFLRQGRPNSGVYSQDNLEEFAQELIGEGINLDINTFKDCLARGISHPGVARASEAAVNNGFNGTTPYALIGSYPISGVVDFAEIEQIVMNQLQ